jgi:hypothetical protein
MHIIGVMGIAGTQNERSLFSMFSLFLFPISLVTFTHDTERYKDKILGTKIIYAV